MRVAASSSSFAPHCGRDQEVLIPGCRVACKQPDPGVRLLNIPLLHVRDRTVPMTDFAWMSSDNRCISGLNSAAGHGCFRTNTIPSSGSYDLIRANVSPPPVSPDARLSRLFTQDFSLSLNPSPSGSFRTAQGVSKYIVARCLELYVGQCGRPS